MEQIEEAIGRFFRYGPDIATKLVFALAVGWGLGQIGEGLKRIASAAERGYFQS